MYKSKYRCSDCKNEFEKITKNFPKRTPACPHCKEGKRVNMKSAVSDKTHVLDSKTRVQQMNESRRPPAMGKSAFTQAMDKTAEIVMEDYNLTNLKDHLREGDSMAPRLQGNDASGVALETRVDQVFQPNKPIMGQNTAGTLNSALMKQINSGAFKNYASTGDFTAREKIVRKPTNVMFEHTEKPN